MQRKSRCPLSANSGHSRPRRQSRTTGSIFLNWWTWHRPKRAEHTTIAGLGFKPLATPLTVIEILASVGWHPLNRLVPTHRAGNRRGFDHGTVPTSLVPPSGYTQQCPLYLRKRTCAVQLDMSAKCQKRTSTTCPVLCDCGRARRCAERVSCTLTTWYGLMVVQRKIHSRADCYVKFKWRPKRRRI